MQVSLRAQPVLTLACQIIAKIDAKRQKNDQRYLDHLKNKYSRKERRILGFTIPGRTLTDDDAVELADAKAASEMFGYWRSEVHYRQYERALDLRSTCRSALSPAGDGRVTLDQADIDLLTFYDKDFTRFLS